MYCVIQRVSNKKKNRYGEPKELRAISFTITNGNEVRTKYSYAYSEERFNRPIRDTYKIMIHHSYRESGAVKKKQWVICTMDFYTLLNHSPSDCIHSQLLKEKLLLMGITEEELWEMVYQKLDPIVEAAEKTFKSTPEYKAERKHKKVLSTYRAEKEAFEKKYGTDTYDYCYDIFGALRNPDYLKVVMDTYKTKQRQQSSSYSGSSYGNYGNTGSTDDFFKEFSSYFGKQQSTYNDEEKAKLKRIYRVLSKNFHPDITKDDGEIMKFINKLKDGWGI